jgi:hypothetical protein
MVLGVSNVALAQVRHQIAPGTRMIIGGVGPADSDRAEADRTRCRIR